MICRSERWLVACFTCSSFFSFVSSAQLLAFTDQMIEIRVWSFNLSGMFVAPELLWLINLLLV